MSRYMSIEARIVDFFETAQEDVVRTVLGIVQGVAKRREITTKVRRPKHARVRQTRKPASVQDSPATLEE